MNNAQKSSTTKVDITVLQGRFTTHDNNEAGQVFMTYSDNQILFEMGVRTVAKLYSYKGECDWCGKVMDGMAVCISNKYFHLFSFNEDGACYQQYLATMKVLKS